MFDFRNLPFGISSLHPAFAASKCDNVSDKLYSVSQRFAYQDPDYKPGIPQKPKQQQQRSKMTVRLRPRKVLCSKCKGICSENSENVVQTRKRKSVDSNPTKEKKSYGSNEIDAKRDRTLIMANSLIPKISRLHPNEINDAINGNAYRRNEIWIRQSEDKAESLAKFKHSDDSNEECAQDFNRDRVSYNSSDKSNSNNKDFDSDGELRTELRDGAHSDDCAPKKKRSENSSNNTDESSSSIFSNARTLKISFGEGEGTVVKLPAAIGEFHSEDEPAQPFSKDVESKAARRALKKAKKQARKLISPVLNPTSPLCVVPYENFPRKKHKVKHKKKKKDDKKAKVVSEDVSGSETPDENHSSIEEPNAPEVDRIREEPAAKVDGAEENKVCENSTTGWVNCEGGYGVGAGDVVWGKLQGFPWWPGRVVGTGGEGHARVAWFASTTSSLVPRHRLAPFLDNFKVFFSCTLKNKKVRYRFRDFKILVCCYLFKFFTTAHNQLVRS